MSVLLELKNLRKEYFGVPAVSGMNLKIRRGEVLGLIGENGAGKSTLMNMIGGVVSATSGNMEWCGESYRPNGASDATRCGIAFIHQELNLFTNLTVAENIFIDGFPTKFGMIDRRAIRDRSSDLLKQLNLDARPETKIDNLAPGERQIVEIAKALHSDAELIIFDEPTTSLTPRETARLFDTMRALKAAGKTIIYISHILSDVQAMCDRVAVLRDGNLVAEGPISEFGIPEMIRAMIGRELGGLFPDRTAPPSEDVLFEATGLSQPGIIEDVSFSIRRGEILGLFGLMGSGRSELARIISGLDPVERGEMRLNNQVLEGGIRSRIAQGLAFVTEDRREEGLMMDAAISDNLSLVSVETFGRAPVGLLDRAKLKTDVERMRDEVRVKAGDIHVQPVRALSGGNQQKVVIGKWLMSQPGMFILDEPTRGVDVGAKYEIYSLADTMAAEGDSILFISSELEELIGMCDRIVVMNRGEIMGEFDRSSFVESAILAMAFGEVSQ